MNYEIILDDPFIPLYGTTLKIPAGSILWRGFDPKYPAISNRPAYFGARKFAQGYANKYGQDAKPFMTSRIINLLDVRYMKVLLSQLFDDNKKNLTDMNIVAATTVAFGLCSLQHQIRLFKNLYNGIYQTTNSSYDSLKSGIANLESILNTSSFYEQKGYRIAETQNDAIVMGFLKELFGQEYDGYIAPITITPFHIEKENFLLNSEIIIFDPANSGIKQVINMPTKLTKATINSIILQSGQNYMTIDTRGMKTSYYKGKGGKSGNSGNNQTVPEVCDDYNTEYEKGNKTIIKLFKQGEKYGRAWRDKPVKLYNAVAPGPEVDPTIFNDFNNVLM
jgi:hypothetical protein